MSKEELAFLTISHLAELIRKREVSPVEVTDVGLPVGLQVMGKPFAEATVLQVAHAYEMNTEWHKRRPPV